jgi:hypothetical protein
MKHVQTRLRILYACVGASLLVYGLRTLLAREIGAGDTLLHGAAWMLRGEPAVLIGFVLGVAGAYLIYLAFNRDR